MQKRYEIWLHSKVKKGERKFELVSQNLTKKEVEGFHKTMKQLHPLSYKKHNSSFETEKGYYFITITRV